MKSVMTQIGWCAALSLLTASPAIADVSACQSAVGTSVKERIADLTTCIFKGKNGVSMNSYLYVLRGISYAELGDVDKAFKDYSTAIALAPDEDAAFAFRGEILANRGDWASAQADFDSAIAHTTANLNVSVSLAFKAWLFATWPDPAKRDGAKAVTLALRALKLRNNALTHDVLAAAYAETGQFNNAVREESAAISRVRGKAGEREAPGYKARLAVYQAGMPYHTQTPFPLPPRLEL